MTDFFSIRVGCLRLIPDGINIVVYAFFPPSLIAYGKFFRRVLWQRNGWCGESRQGLKLGGNTAAPC